MGDTGMVRFLYVRFLFAAMGFLVVAIDGQTGDLQAELNECRALNTDKSSVIFDLREQLAHLQQDPACSQAVQSMTDAPTPTPTDAPTPTPTSTPTSTPVSCPGGAPMIKIESNSGSCSNGGATSTDCIPASDLNEAAEIVRFNAPTYSAGGV